MLSPETVRGVGRADECEDVRYTFTVGEEGSESKSRVLLRDEEEMGMGGAIRLEPERRGSSVLDEFALDVLMFVRRAPWREGGGGGGDFAEDIASWLLGAGLDI